MKVKLCEGTTAEELEEKIQSTVDEMQAQGFFLKHLSYSSSDDYDNNYFEKSALLVFDVKELCASATENL